MSKIEIKSYNIGFYIYNCYCKKIGEFVENKRTGSEFVIVIQDKLGKKIPAYQFVSFGKTKEADFTKENLVELLQEHYETYNIINQLTYFNVDSFYLEGQAHDIAIDNYKDDIKRWTKEKQKYMRAAGTKELEKKYEIEYDEIINDYKKRIEFLENN